MQGIPDGSVVKPYSLFDRLRSVPDDLGLTREQRERWQAVLAGPLTDITSIRGRIARDPARSAEWAPSLLSALEADATRYAARLGMTRNLLTTLTPFYTSLTLTQRKRADRLLGCLFS
jgi:LTXXQ motif family protein